MEFKLSPSQSRILLAELNYPGTLAYNTYFQMRFDAEDLPWLEQAIPKVISGNFGLRVRSGENGYVQYYSDEPAQFKRLNLKGCDPQAIEGKLDALRDVPITPLFDAPLYLLYLIETDDSILLFFAFHHMIVDYTTLNRVLSTQLSDCVAALKAGRDWKASARSYDEYLRRVDAYLATPEAEADR